ncbi:PTS transporter subunit EIIC [uncultured Clostridium sp.]|jgi:PTS system N-acetylglucosamine-specific IIC component|uniref:PTS transporter subunit EIIC n=1 Tax=uncultured Clostridium sp. TaxID=59620 RepID=UPI00261E312C|nr:PTS transporter subunit EIIC [uncultured Clostridium sp.]
MGKTILGFLQKIGKSLMLPIATLPVAALLLRFGQQDIIDFFGLPEYVGFLSAAGGALFDNLPLIFAIGVAIGLSDDGDGAAGLSGAVGYLVLEKASRFVWITNYGEDIAATLKFDSFGGIIAGIVAGYCYNKCKKIKLSGFLAEVKGLFAPIATTLVLILLSIAFGFIWETIQDGINTLGASVVSMGAVGAGIFGLLNRLIVPMGLHHVLNSYFWFTLGEFDGKAGDLHRFFAGDPTAGTYMAGFFPVMMFGLPAIALAIYFAAKKEQRKAVAGMLASLAFTSFLTGITEPIEFMFIFLSPVLLVAHAILTGLSMGVTAAFGVLHGFGFSAGFIDYVLNFNLSTNGFLIIPIGLGVGAAYFFVFLFLIKKFNVPTPGREDDDELGENIKISKNTDMKELAASYIIALGGADNLRVVDNCVTRLRLEVGTAKIIEDKNLKALGAKGVVRLSDSTIQVIVGTNVQFVSDAIKAELKKVKA